MLEKEVTLLRLTSIIPFMQKQFQCSGPPVLQPLLGNVRSVYILEDVI